MSAVPGPLRGLVPGDRVKIVAEVVESVYDGWVTVEILSGAGTPAPFSIRIIVPATCAEPDGPVKTPGQAAFEASREISASRSGFAIKGDTWEAMSWDAQHRWELVARAARAIR